ncbi:MAG: NADH-quinone oxidoreductase subunit C [Eubacteriales bacterium]|nr:NADH-quinone oxidoreductase subunit C [Eubacteriales bacterium]
MDDKNEIRQIPMEDFFTEVIRMKMDGWRLVQICAVRVPVGYELSYSFCRDYRMLTLRLHSGLDEEVSSITQIYPCAFIQENEAAELFGVPIRNLNLDYHHRLYRIDRETPFKEKG